MPMELGCICVGGRETDSSCRSVARVLLAYFKGLKRDDVADLDVPLGMLYMLEPVRTNCNLSGHGLTLDIEAIWC